MRGIIKYRGFTLLETILAMWITAIIAFSTMVCISSFGIKDEQHKIQALNLVRSEMELIKYEITREGFALDGSKYHLTPDKLIPITKEPKDGAYSKIYWLVDRVVIQTPESQLAQETASNSEIDIEFKPLKLPVYEVTESIHNSYKTLKPGYIVNKIQSSEDSENQEKSKEAIETSYLNNCLNQPTQTTQTKYIDYIKKALPKNCPIKDDKDVFNYIYPFILDVKIHRTVESRYQEYKALANSDKIIDFKEGKTSETIDEEKLKIEDKNIDNLFFKYNIEIIAGWFQKYNGRFRMTNSKYNLEVKHPMSNNYTLQ